MNILFRTVLKAIAGVAATLGLGWLATRGLDWTTTLRSFHGLSIPLVFLSLALLVVAGLVRAFRWQVFFLRNRVTLLRLFRVQNEGVGLNNLMPIGVASEATQVVILTLRDHLDPPTVMATVLMERATSFVAGMFVLAVCFLLYANKDYFVVYAAASFALSLLTVIAVGFVVRLSRVGLVRRLPYVYGIILASQELHQQRTRVWVSVGLGMVYWILVGVALWIVLLDLGTVLPISAMVLVTTAAVTFVVILPITPAAIGTFEIAVTYGLHLFGVPREAAFSVGVVAHALIFVPPTLIAVLALPHERIGAMSQIRKLGVKVMSEKRDPNHPSRAG